MHRANLDRAGLSAGDPCGRVARLFDRVALEEEVPAECLLDLRVRPIDDEGLRVTDANTRGVSRRGQLVAADHHARRVCLACELAVVLHRLAPLTVLQPVPAAHVGLHQCQGLPVTSLCWMTPLCQTGAGA